MKHLPRRATILLLFRQVISWPGAEIRRFHHRMGLNNHGQATPPEGNDFVAVSAGWDYSLALKSDGSIIVWGETRYGQTPPPAGNDFIAISAGFLESMALRSDGSFVVWRNGIKTTMGNDFIAISGSFDNQMALRSDGSVVILGFNPPTDSDFIAVSACYSHTLALRTNGSIVKWGLEFLTAHRRRRREIILSPLRQATIAYALRSDGSIIVWGNFGGHSPGKQ